MEKRYQPERPTVRYPSGMDLRQLRRAILDGRYRVPADKVAEAMLRHPSAVIGCGIPLSAIPRDL
jgi:hypothetical protein